MSARGIGHLDGPALRPDGSQYDVAIAASEYEEAVASREVAADAVEAMWLGTERALAAAVRLEFPGMEITAFDRVDWIEPASLLAYWGEGIAFEIGPDHGQAHQDIGGGGGPLHHWVRVYFESEEVAYAHGRSFREALEALDRSDETIREATETLMTWSDPGVSQIREGDTVFLGGAPAVVVGCPATPPTDASPGVEPCVPDAKVWCERCGWLGREVECYTATAGCVCPSCGSMWEITEGRPLNGMRATSGVRFNASADSWVDEVWPDDLQRGRRYTGSRPASVLSEAVERTDERLRVWRAEDIQQILNERDESRGQRDAFQAQLGAVIRELRRAASGTGPQAPVEPGEDPAGALAARLLRLLGGGK